MLKLEQNYEQRTFKADFGIVLNFCNMDEIVKLRSFEPQQIYSVLI